MRAECSRSSVPAACLLLLKQAGLVGQVAPPGLPELAGILLGQGVHDAGHTAGTVALIGDSLKVLGVSGTVLSRAVPAR